MLRILVVVVVYNKLVSEIENLSNIRSADVLIYDNSENPQDPPANTHYFHNWNNGGVSMAYNYGIELAKMLNKDYLILLDQDTSFDDQCIAMYGKYAEKFGKHYIYVPIIKNGLKIYSPFVEGRCKNHTQNMYDLKYDMIYDLRGKSVINSGMMIPLDLIADIGNFNEKIRLDFSDTYFIDKYKKHNHEVILVDVNLEHKLSGDEGKNKKKELARFIYYCNGAKIYLITASNVQRVKRLVFFRMLRLVAKYVSFTPFIIYWKYFLGDAII